MPPIAKHKATLPIKGGGQSKPKFGPRVGSEHMERCASGEVGGSGTPSSKHPLQRRVEDWGQHRVSFTCETIEQEMGLSWEHLASSVGRMCDF